MFRFLKRIGPKKLLARMLMIVVVPILSIQLITGTLFYTRHFEKISSRMAQSVVSELMFTFNLLDKYPEKTDEIIEAAKKSFGIEISLQNVRARIKKRRNILDPIEIEDLSNTLKEKLSEPFLLYRSQDDRTLIVRIERQGEEIQIKIPRKRVFSHTFYIVLGWMLLSGVILLILATIFMRNQVRSVEYLSWAAERFGRGENDEKFKPTGAREVRRAGIALIEMNNRLRKQVSERTSMLSGISHDLKTPLTRMKLTLSMMKPKTKSVESIEEDVIEMERMVTAYLDFAKGEGKERTKQIKLRPFLKGILKKYPKVAADIKGDAVIHAREDEIRRMLNNIIGNAERYAPHVWFQAVVRKKEITFIVDDDGQGIPKGKRDFVFKPFARLEGSRNIKTGGIGLGMTISRDIATGHGGRILLSDSPRGGLRVSIHLPK